MYTNFLLYQLMYQKRGNLLKVPFVRSCHIFMFEKNQEACFLLRSAIKKEDKWKVRKKSYERKKERKGKERTKEGKCRVQ